MAKKSISKNAIFYQKRIGQFLFLFLIRTNSHSRTIIRREKTKIETIRTPDETPKNKGKMTLFAKISKKMK